jgi:hypothetical protein
MARKPKIEKIDFKQVEIAGELGLTDKEIAQFFSISERTLNEYKKKYPEFLQSLKRGKEISDTKVARALFLRATGYSHPEVNITNYKGKIIKTAIIKHYAPDVTAQIFWLKNRLPAQWRDKIEALPKDNIDLPENLDDLTDQEINELYDRAKKDRT